MDGEAILLTNQCYTMNACNIEKLIAAESYNVNGTIPSEIGNLSNLRECLIQRTNIGGTIPSEIGRLSNLGKPSSLTAPTVLANITNFFRIFYVPLTMFCRLEEFAVGHLALLDDSVAPQGSLPSEIGNCLNLKSFFVDASYMSGIIPPSLGNLSALHTLTLKNSEFEGSIPDSLQKLSTNIRGLDLHGNAFTGTLPEWLGTFEELRSLRVFWNLLTGSVPSTLCRASLEVQYDCELTCDCCGPCGPISSR